MSDQDNRVRPFLPVSRFLEKPLARLGIDHGSVADESLTELGDVAETLFIRTGPRAELDPVHLDVHGAGHAGGQQRLAGRAGVVGGIELVRETGVVHLAQRHILGKTAGRHNNGFRGLDESGLS